MCGVSYWRANRDSSPVARKQAYSHILGRAFLLSSLFLTTSYNVTFAFGKPLSALDAIARSSASRPSSPADKEAGIPLTEEFVQQIPLRSHLRSLSATSALSEISSPAQSRYQTWWTKLKLLVSSYGLRVEYFTRVLGNTSDHNWSRFQSWWMKIGLLVVICCLRVETFRQATLNTECATAGYTCAIPFIISLYDYRRNQRFRQVEAYVPLQRFQNLPVQLLLSFCRRTQYLLTQSRLKGIIAATLLSSGGLLAASFSAGSQSTYICSLTTSDASHLQTIKIFNVLVDSLLLIGVVELYRNGSRLDEARRKRTLVSLGAGLIAVGAIWAITGFVVSNGRPEHSGQPVLDLDYTHSAFNQAVLVVIFAVSAWLMLPHFGLLGLTLIGGFMFIYFSSVSIFVVGQMPFPFISLARSVAPFIFTFTGVVIFLQGRPVSEEHTKPLFFRTHVLLQVFFAFLALVGLIFAGSKHRLAHVHPIELLIHDGRIHHNKFVEQASVSKNISAAVVEYRRRYNQHPPPGFDKWYQYATSRSSVVIDDFDQIYDNLLPFRTLRPDHIRKMTHQLATNPFNDLGGISIRNGKTKVQDGIRESHAWMVIAAAQMIDNFAEHLPDMDLVFNLNDEPRIAVPWEKASVITQEARMQEPVPDENVVSTWSANRHQNWGSIEPPEQTEETVFTDGAWRGVFDPYVSAVCPPTSKARSQRIWDRREICLSCAGPHSMGQFPLDFMRASEICHQPDLAFLHGLMISPSSFKVSQELVPVFSQSAIFGFNDILYPSPWNYVNKTKYAPSDEHPDPHYYHKKNSLYWVGSTSEGFSRFGEWKGMPRQRFTHLINNNTQSQVSVLLPASKNSYRYEIMDGGAPMRDLQLQTSVRLADPIVRCTDCEKQQAEMGTTGWAEFQDHWANRFLFDADGAGFSGRFLPFLLSHSLPLKTGLFRQWFDSRVTSWMHFVPIDIRLHGLWSTLAFFAGVVDPASDPDDPDILMKPHEAQGLWIAEEGRNWAQVALRKEDMEIYFFRLLLEWGRLTDDQRDVLGFKP
ncbi:hypothetical protein NUU61_009445 [Penicillium alfredii]|uniref:Glycosyl transferase CAP10 domain-containing protein n=1 Tax=Penicillium alfredii TaxID=1506179 RepID=A0A9W9ENE0_9EURO|nr:uncharacterized protein NUU61_009445 [Penicillium alfredii]KAJ5084866.1 hypothetical protein NUU61_009445 [Penicillium alfredii]